jgi:hypothetical protein
MHDSGSSGRADDFQMQQRLRRRPAHGVAYDLPLGVNLENLAGVHPALVDRARSDCQPQRVTREYRTEITTRSKHPAPAVEVGSEPDEFFGGIR